MSQVRAEPIMMESFTSTNDVHVHVNEPRRNTNPTERRPKEPPHQSAIKLKYKYVIQHYTNILLLLIIICTLVPFVIILVRSALRPGLHYCELDTNCPSYDLTVILSDGGTLAFGISVYVVFATLAVLVLLSSGSWNPHSYRNKVICLFALFLMFWSVIQFSATFAHRGYVIPYSVLQPYSIQIGFIGSGTAQVEVIDFSSQFYDGKHAMLEVLKVHNSGDTPHSISPTSKVIYSDSWSDVSTVEPNFSRTQVVSNLENNKAYLFILRPAKKDGDDAVHAGYRESIQKQQIPTGVYSGAFSHDTFVDLRAFQFCRWNQDSGCT